MEDLFKTSVNSPVFIIAEIGQNHQGDINIAKKLILQAKQCGADCVKFQKTCLTEKFTEAVLQTPYLTEHSWGSTYGEHKAFLEFSEEEFIQLQQYASAQEILFTASAMDMNSLEFLLKIKVPFIKIGSGDANNFLLIEKAAKSHVPLIISTGMQDFNTVKKIYKIVSKHHNQFALLHCISAYPTPYEQINLRVIPFYKTEFPDIVIGYSGHELGIHITTAAVALGAKIIERHFTLNKNQKGSDHQCSLVPDELRQLIKNIRDLEIGLGQPKKVLEQCELPCFRKLRKSLVYARGLKAGCTLRPEDLKAKVTREAGVDGSELEDVLGRILKVDVGVDQSVILEHLEAKEVLL